MSLRPASAADVPALAEFFAVPEVAEWWPGENSERLRAALTLHPDHHRITWTCLLGEFVF